MKFQLAINLERMDDSIETSEVARHTLEMVQMADVGGFNIVWAAEHHALEMTIAPNPFQILTWWATHTDNIRLGSAVAVAAYWHPINLAGEAAMLDVISGGRLEFGIGSGAYQREFDRMRPGLLQSDAWRHMQEMLPVVKALWAGDYAHDGAVWQFPTATSVPKPLQPDPRVWVAARSPITFDYAVKNGCHVMSWPIARPFAEAELYAQQLTDTVAANQGAERPIFALMRHTAVYDSADDWMVPVIAAQRQLGQLLWVHVHRGITSGQGARGGVCEPFEAHDVLLVRPQHHRQSGADELDRIGTYSQQGVRLPGGARGGDHRHRHRSRTVALHGQQGQFTGGMGRRSSAVGLTSCCRVIGQLCGQRAAAIVSGPG